MDSFDTPNLLSGGSQLLDQSPQFSFNSASSSLHTGPGGDDLSLSELYPDNRLPKTEPQTRNPKTRPSIAEALGFGAPLDQSDDQSVLHALEEGEEREEEDAGIGEDEEGTEADVTVRGGDEDANRTSIAAQSREEKLQSDLFVLRQLNGAFAVYNDALREAQGGTEVSCSCFYWLLRVFFFFLTPLLQASRRAARTDGRTTQQIHQYPIQVRAGQAAYIRRAMDGRRGGMGAISLPLVSSHADLWYAFGSQDEAQLEEEERVREEKRRREEEERQRAAQREQERKEKEELERAMRDEAERLEREKRDRPSARSTSGVRGVRGTRASMRAGAAARGGSRTGARFLKPQLPKFFSRPR